MSDNVLFFPYILPPNRDWLVRSVLYWDLVGRIVPSGATLSEEMAALIREGWVILVPPNKHQGVLESVGFQLIEAVRANRESLTSTNRDYFEMWPEKFSGNILYDLAELGVATRPGRNYLVDKRIAMAYMAALALALGKVENMTPAADSLDALTSFGSAEYRSTLEIITDDQFIAIERLLPAPTGRNALRRAIEFRRRNEKLLPNFRREVDKRVQDLLVNYSTQRPEVRRDRLAMLADDLQRESGQIAAAMSEGGRGGVTRGTLCTLGSGTAGIAGGAGALVTGNPLGALALVGGAMTVYKGYKEVKKNQSQAAKAAREPLAYAVLYRKTFN